MCVVSLVDIVAAAVLSGNRNFEGRVHPLTRANYLASPPLVVAYALAGTVSLALDFFTDSSSHHHYLSSYLPLFGNNLTVIRLL